MWKVGEKYKSDNRWWVKLTCDKCGYVTSRRQNLLTIEIRCKVCGTIDRNRKTFGKHHGEGDLSLTYFKYFRNTAKRRGLEFSLTVGYLWNLFEEQNHQCPLSGLPLKMPRGTGVGGALTDGSSPSLDRIDSTKGYVEGNVQWVHKYVNLMKLDLSTEQFVSICNLVASKHPASGTPDLSSTRLCRGRKKRDNS